MVDVISKITEFANFRNVFIIAGAISLIAFAMNAGVFTATQSSMNLFMMAFSGGSIIFWVVMARNSRNIIYRDAVVGEPMSEKSLDAQLEGHRRYTMFEKDMVAWQWENEPNTVHAMQTIEVKLSRLTAHDMSEVELARMTRDYESIMNTGDVSIITLHARKKVFAKDWVSKMERKRDNLDFDAQLGGRTTHGEKAAAVTATLERIKIGLENVYDSRFFIIVAASAPNLERVKANLRTAVNAIIERLRDQLKLEVGLLKGSKLEEATSFFRVYTSLGAPRDRVTRLQSFRHLSFDMNWHNPFAVPRIPPLSKLMKGIYIGTLMTTGQPVSWDPDDPEMGSPHFLGIGPTGSGKTTMGRTFLVRALDNGIPYWVIDPAGDYTDFTRGLGGEVIDFEEETLNPFVLYDRNPVNVAKVVTDMVTLIAGLQSPERYFLQERILESYSAAGVDVTKHETWKDETSNKVNFESIYNEINHNLERGRYSGTDALLARGVLHKIQDLSVGKYALKEQTLNLDKIFQDKKPVCFYVREALGENLRRALAWTLIMQLRALTFTRYKISEELRLFLLVDEAHHFVKAMISPALPGGRIDTPLVAFVREMRKKGVACWMLSQAPEDFMNPGERTSPIFINVGTTLMLGKADQAYMEFVTRYMGLTDDEAYGPNGLYWMTRHGQGILKKANDPRPIPIQVEADQRAVTKSREGGELLEEYIPEDEKTAPPLTPEMKQLMDEEKRKAKEESDEEKEDGKEESPTNNHSEDDN